MILSLLILKLTLEGILKECNTLAQKENIRNEIEFLKSELFKVQSAFEKNEITEEDMKNKEEECIRKIQDISNKTSNGTNGMNLDLGF